MPDLYDLFLEEFMRKTLILLLMTMIMSSCGLQSIPTAKNDVEASWAEVQNQYKRRMDLIPNLVNTVKGYAVHEAKTLKDVVEARARATSVNIDPSKLNAQSMKSFSNAQGALSSALGRLMVVVEKYPALKANQNFRDLQVQLEGTENRITVSRNRYIQSVKQYNNLITVPPTSWFNSLFYKHEKKPQFQVEDIKKAQEAPKVEF